MGEALADERPTPLTTNVEFQYPQIAPISQSFSTLLQNSKATSMADKTDDLQYSNSLEDSWVVDEDQYSEDSTARSIIEKNLEGIGQRQAPSQDGEDADSTTYTTESEEAPSLAEPADEDNRNSSLTVRSEHDPILHFQEVGLSHDLTGIDSTYTLCTFDRQESAIVKTCRDISSGAEQLHMAVGMIMSRHPLALEQPLRLLYVGDPNQRLDVLAKFGDALLASPRGMEESRLGVISTSPDHNGPFEIGPIQAQIVIDECVAVASIKIQPGQQEQIHLRLKKGNGAYLKSTWNDGRYEVSPQQEWSAPDLAVLLFSADDDKVARERLRLTHAFMERHDVPMMLLCDSPTWESEISFPMLGSHSLHLCIESRSAEESTDRVLQQIPVDLGTFECIDAAQLNRHVAYLLEKKDTGREFNVKPVSRNTTISPPSIVKDIEKNLSKSFYQTDVNVRRLLEQPALQVAALLTLTLISSIVIYCSFWATSFKPTVQHGGFVSPSSVSQFATSSLTSTTSTVAVPSIQASAPNSLVAIEKFETSLSTIPTDLKDTVRKPIVPAEVPNESTTFAVDISKPYQLIVTAPRKVPRKGLRFIITVHRGSEELDVQVSVPVNHTWTVTLAPEDCFGKLNVTVTVEKPFEKLNYEVDFGTRPSNFSTWCRSRLAMAQQVLNDVISQTIKLRSKEETVEGGNLISPLRSLGRQAHIAQLKATTAFRDTTKELNSRAQKLGKACVATVNEEWRHLEMKGSSLRKEARQYRDDWALVFRVLGAYYRPEISSSRVQVTQFWQSATNSLTGLTKDFMSRSPHIWSSLATAQERAKVLAEKLTGRNSTTKRKNEKSYSTRGEFHRRGKEGGKKPGSKKGSRKMP